MYITYVYVLHTHTHVYAHIKIYTYIHIRVQASLNSSSSDSMEDWLEWHVNLLPPDDSPFSGAIYHVVLIFPGNYPQVAIFINQMK